MKVIENALFISAILFLIIGGGVAVFKFGFDIGWRSANATQQNDDYNRAISGDTTTYMGMTASSTMSIYKVRQGYDALAQTLNPATLLKTVGLDNTLDPNLPTAIMFFTHKSCQICVGEMVELLYSLSDNCNRLNVIAICRSSDALAAQAYRPTTFSKLVYVIDTTLSSGITPSWLYLEPHKPVVFIVDSSSCVVASYFLQEKDLDTRRRFSEAVMRLFQSKPFQIKK